MWVTILTAEVFKAKAVPCVRWSRHAGGRSGPTLALSYTVVIMGIPWCRKGLACSCGFDPRSCGCTFIAQNARKEKKKERSAWVHGEGSRMVSRQGWRTMTNTITDTLWHQWLDLCAGYVMIINNKRTASLFWQLSWHRAGMNFF